MEWLEVFKRQHKDNEAITNEIVAQAHLENYALKLFNYADQQDRAANFQKFVIVCHLRINLKKKNQLTSI